MPGRVEVNGHTDDQPLRSFRYRDNFELSRERAVSVVDVLKRTIDSPAAACACRARDRPNPSTTEPGAQPARGNHPRARHLARGPDCQAVFTMLSLLKRIIQLLPGFLLIAAVIWLAGPYLVISGSRPLETESSRLTAIVFVVLAWLAWVLFERWASRRASSKLASAVINQAAAEPLPSGDVVKLRESFEQAVAALGSRQKGRTLYDLPWYVFIGAARIGQDDRAAQLRPAFPAGRLRRARARLRGVGGTRNCDWWFTDEAVFLDTAGRFTTQDSDASADSAGWKEFLALLTKYRKRRPINGVILTISVKDLLTQGESAREQQIEAARYRLRELGRELQIELPVYVMVTMCDLIAGFAEYFDDQAQEGRAQVWGVTFPYEKTVSGQVAADVPARVRGAGDAAERAPVRQARGGNRRPPPRAGSSPSRSRWPSLRDSLAQYLTDVFAATSGDQRILLRGVYFTSGTQEGTPIDRLLGAIGRGFRVAPEAVAAPGGRGKAYFVERLLKQVLIGESGLAGVNRRLEMRNAPCSSRLRGHRAHRRPRPGCAVAQLREQPRVHGVRCRTRSPPCAVCGPRHERPRSRRSCRTSMPCAPSPIRRTATAKTRRCGCDGGCIKAVPSATPRATPICASSTASCCRGSPRASGSI